MRRPTQKTLRTVAVLTTWRGPKPPTPPPTTAPIFDFEPVTTEDIRLWLRTVARMDPDSHRAPAYIRNYCVPDKIARAKAQGRWPPTGKWID